MVTPPLTGQPPTGPAQAGDAGGQEMTTIQREIDAIAHYVESLRLAINGLRAPELVGHRLPALRNDLSSIVIMTREAADSVLGAAEAILACQDSGSTYRGFVEDRMIGLMETCSFQDLTGQRMSRVADALLALEQRLNTFISEARARNGALPGSDLAVLQAEREASRLTHGPDSPDGLEQAAIDTLLAG